MQYTPAMAAMLKALGEGPATFAQLRQSTVAAGSLKSYADVVRMLTWLAQNKDIVSAGDGLYRLNPVADMQVQAAKPKPLELIEPVAKQLCVDLAEHADRIEVAGAIRRKVSMVPKIELVALVHARPTLFSYIARAEPVPALRDAFLHRSELKMVDQLYHSSILIVDEHIGAVKVDLSVIADPKGVGGCSTSQKPVPPISLIERFPIGEKYHKEG